MATYICDEKLDAMIERLRPVTSAIPDLKDQPMGFSSDENKMPIIFFSSEEGIAAFRNAATSFEPGSRMAGWLDRHPPALRIHPRYATAHV